MATYDIQITKPAESDLLEIIWYISKELLEPETAQRVISRISNAIISLGSMQFRHALVSHELLAQKGIRKIVVNNYIVFYIVDEESKIVTIIRVLYNRRDWQNFL
ncbi:hypothetical protein SYNTR_1823 [Candidatus Syntrophocurvum alkaliphilum]|uniref:Death on curing protein, Doc toxin n=1 Tax=Candidatus Syntrophocurvum alkaliphilum TaxID=2293317 RepID=A0A6I6DK31_9FIRM|nr:type II toxin-antitoxin system RelE/ParE family toxin [Candidatus Syntrophocurvum alkaliphilum]QGU00417.1 hypothetical protein SYNTR_1823 [Candidatus Syntrophocurvum alkaliphilum]